MGFFKKLFSRHKKTDASNQPQPNGGQHPPQQQPPQPEQHAPPPQQQQQPPPASEPSHPVESNPPAPQEPAPTTTTTTTTTTSTSSTLTIREKLEDIMKAVGEKRILEVFDKYYANDIVMYENGDATNRHGREENRASEVAFTENAVVHEATVKKVIVDGNLTAYEMYLDFTYAGENVKKNQWAFQEWNDQGLIVKEEFLYK
ncbi:hypothetical protein PPL_12496 [Heterostelium album PN500]|uniref:SnoaL-like domain-containing protein n=1 Tax=Heterostelium pallidum (strain ATCC 26659 / Pp 5 / PN500) TaxID=670386 RepID=D3BMS3_HETP5|nr:hypothetical protein PPL_12496 [Heterostelium album PN500]EFA77285.1 hypothetical protein PPL_12496 [Heterostelium album PN500]|eukprot:XP_020429414.1 hypothetical protein PPL_12496 [Heterostelium album PN500]